MTYVFINGNRIQALSVILLVVGSWLSASADTRLITKLDIMDAWKENHNASHWIEQGNIRVGQFMYGELDIPVTSLSKELAGADWIQTAYGSKSFTGAVIATFRLTYDAKVYIAHSKKITNKPTWLKAYQRTPYGLTNPGAEFEVYSRTYKKGDIVSLGANGNTGEQMYIVLVKPIGILPAPTKPTGKIFDIGKFGGVGDGKTMNTNAVQTAIDACSAAGGGSVYFHDGIFMTGSFVMKSNVTLHIEAGSILRGSPDIKDYQPRVVSLPSYRGTEVHQLIYAEKAKHIGITGGGIIDGYSQGNGHPWNNKLGLYNRPRLIRMFECEDINISHISMIRSPYWTQYYEGCSNMKLDDVRVRCYTGLHNQDGIDISACSNVELSNFYAISGDDAVCIKSMSDKKSSNLNIHDVLIRYSNCHAIKIGTETHSDIKHVQVRNVVVGGARYGTAVESVDGSAVEDVVYENILLKDCGAPILIRLGQRGRVFPGGPQKAALSTMKNITMRNITNTGIGYVDLKGGPGLGVVISGLPGQNIENLTIENCNFLLYGSLKDPDLVNRDVPENPEVYPEIDILGTCPAYGLFARHIRGLVYKNVSITCKFVDVRPAIVMDDVKGYSLLGVKVESYPITKPFPVWHKQDGQLQPANSSDKK